MDPPRAEPRPQTKCNFLGVVSSWSAGRGATALPTHHQHGRAWSARLRPAALVLSVSGSPGRRAPSSPSPRPLAAASRVPRRGSRPEAGAGAGLRLVRARGRPPCDLGWRLPPCAVSAERALNRPCAAPASSLSAPPARLAGRGAGSRPPQPGRPEAGRPRAPGEPGRGGGGPGAAPGNGRWSWEGAERAGGDRTGTHPLLLCSHPRA